MNQVCTYGPITNDTNVLGITRQLIGGKGVCFWKQLINGMHLGGHLHCVEYVVVPPGASIGWHTHERTEEIYYILSGRATMDMDGHPREVAAGDLITTPLGASHALANPTEQFLTVFVVEVFPRETGKPGEVAHIQLRSQLLERRAAQEAREGVFSASIDLARYFTGHWAELTLAHIPPGGQLNLYTCEGRDEVLFVASGLAEITFGDESISGRDGLCIGLPAHVSRTVCNASLIEPLEIIRAEVCTGV
jgi:mannose-6-phosphate isomerase-like protein (cupin superfamily)